jgi:hypothetical protein
MQHLATTPFLNGSDSEEAFGTHSGTRSSSTIVVGTVRPGTQPQLETDAHQMVQEIGLIDQLHSLYADRAKMEAAIGLSDADDIIRHVLQLRREQFASHSDIATAMELLGTVKTRLDGKR